MQHFTAKAERKKKIRLILRNLREELQDISTALKEHLQRHELVKVRIAIPSWDAVQNSDLALDLIELDSYDELIRVYSTIEEFNENRHTESDENLRELRD